MERHTADYNLTVAIQAENTAAWEVITADGDHNERVARLMWEAAKEDLAAANADVAAIAALAAR